jgi:hypothetical protein
MLTSNTDFALTLNQALGYHCIQHVAVSTVFDKPSRVPKPRLLVGELAH